MTGASKQDVLFFSPRSMPTTASRVSEKTPMAKPSAKLDMNHCFMPTTGQLDRASACSASVLSAAVTLPRRERAFTAPARERGRYCEAKASKWLIVGGWKTHLKTQLDGRVDLVVQNHLNIQ